MEEISVNCVLVTGASGFVAKALCEKLLLDEYKVTGSSRSIEKIPFGVHAVQMPSLDDQTDWTTPLQECRYVVHLAARAHMLRDNADDSLNEFRAINTSGTLNLARQAEKMGVERFVFVSSIGVNGAQTFGQPYHRDDIPAPHSDYAVSKYEAEQALIELGKRTAMEIVIVRPPLVYGRNAPGNVGTLIQWIRRGIPFPFGSVKNRRTLVSVENLADLLATTLWHPNAGGKIFLAGDGQDLSTAGLLQKIAKFEGKKAKIFAFPVWVLRLCANLCGKKQLINSLTGDLQIDISDTCDDLDWQPKPLK